MTKFTLNVMSPLHVASYKPGNLTGCEKFIAHVYKREGDLEAFEGELRSAAELGADAISVDIWWGLVQARKNSFNWKYYSDVFARILKVCREREGQSFKPLKVVPILSFHQCGGNVNDDFFMPIPLWVWDHVRDKARTELDDRNIDILDVTYLTKYDVPSLEYVSLWADEFVKDLYRSFMIDFQRFISDISFPQEYIQEINISLGPAGEMRYPSYNTHDWGTYPYHGPMQCSGKLADRSFRKYCADNGLNITETASSLICAEGVFRERRFEYEDKFKHLIAWYSDSLYKHGENVLKLAAMTFGGNGWKDIPIGFKIPGIHWRMNAHTDALNKEKYLGHDAYSKGIMEDFPRLPEMTAGLIATDMFDDPENPSDDERQYKSKLTNLFDALVDRPGGYIFHFTCLEKTDNNQDGSQSIAGSLVRLIHKVVKRYNNGDYSPKVILKGENALNVMNLTLIDNLKTLEEFKGVTILRISDFILAMNRKDHEGNKTYRYLFHEMCATRGFDKNYTEHKM